MSYVVFFVKFFHLKVSHNVRYDVGVVVYSCAVHHVHPFLRAEWHSLNQDADF